ncbi:hypothetical protein NFI96_000530 [Prochilodus magdalenae]|nr:hypothetical protein NFI96_000530 [Prochilodus magdalenae]
MNPCVGGSVVSTEMNGLLSFVTRPEGLVSLHLHPTAQSGGTFLCELLGIMNCVNTDTVICSFRGSVSHGLTLEIGETVQILEKCEGWFRGFSTKKPTVKGIFPANYVYLRKAVVTNRGLCKKQKLSGQQPGLAKQNNQEVN